MHNTGKILLFLFLFFSGLLVRFSVIAQCTANINAFPYNEGFEQSNNGNWISIPAQQWTCGTPGAGKAVITNPGGGVKSWIVGGLTGSSYANGNSELRSPCFDFSSLSNPEVIFKVFWETERRFDGCTFQYSLNRGNTWTTLGSVNSNANCDGVNWFTYTPITYLGGEPGWSGNIQTSGGGGGNCLYGLGSGRWVTAKHNMGMLAGVPDVMFRFYFGAGTQCNDFDGFAVDDFYIGETPPPGIVDFSYSCLGNAIQFTNHSASCSVAWDFGDPISAQLNFSTDLNPVHSFSGPGEYTVSLTVVFPSGASAIKTYTVGILGAAPVALNLNKCNGESSNSFSVTNLSGGAGNYTYSWNTNPVQTTQTVSNLPGRANPYIVTISSPVARCPITLPFDYPDPPVLLVSANPSPARCTSNNGSITATVSGGKSPYIYNWNTAPFPNTPSINNLPGGLYSLELTDNLGCVKRVNNIEVRNISPVLNISLGNNTTICPGQTLVLNPGAYASYQWQDNSTGPSFTVTRTGTYSVRVTDADGCTGSGTVDVIVDCRGVYFPAAFTPGSDALNSTFGAIGDIGSLIKYSLVIYNRYAQVVFATTDPFRKWDGTYKGKQLDTDSFVWTANYTLPGQKNFFRKGTILVIR